MTIKSSWLFDECGNSIHYVSFSPVFGRTVDVFSGCGELASHNRVYLHSPANLTFKIYIYVSTNEISSAKVTSS